MFKLIRLQDVTGDGAELVIQTTQGQTHIIQLFLDEEGLVGLELERGFFGVEADNLVFLNPGEEMTVANGNSSE